MTTGLENLNIYKLAVRLEIFIYKVLERFPAEEKYRSVDQIKRSSSSIPNNIAESYGKFSYKTRIHHLYIARGEAEETKSGIDRAYKKGFISKEMCEFTTNKYVELLKGINAYIKYLKIKEEQLRN
jgi:four helix bundle protein